MLAAEEEGVRSFSCAAEVVVVAAVDLEIRAPFGAALRRRGRRILLLLLPPLLRLPCWW